MKSPPDALAALRAATSPGAVAAASAPPLAPGSAAAGGLAAAPELGPPASSGVLSVRLLHAQGLAASACSSDGVYVLGHLLPAPPADVGDGGAVLEGNDGRSAPATVVGGGLVWDAAADSDHSGAAAAAAAAAAAGAGHGCALRFDLRRNNALQRNEVASILLELWDRRVVFSDALVGSCFVRLPTKAGAAPLSLGQPLCFDVTTGGTLTVELTHSEQEEAAARSSAAGREAARAQMRRTTMGRALRHAGAGGGDDQSAAVIAKLADKLGLDD